MKFYFIYVDQSVRKYIFSTIFIVIPKTKTAYEPTISIVIPTIKILGVSRPNLITIFFVMRTVLIVGGPTN